MTDKERARRNERYEKYKLAYTALMLVYPFTLEDLEGEIWRDIKGFGGRYQISNYGRVKSFHNSKVKILKPLLQSGGYLYFVIYDCGRCRKYVHRLVAEAFLQNPENKATINHLDGCKMNNFVENLEWATLSENVQHAIEIGAKQSGGESYQAKLTDEEAVWCRSVYIPGDEKFGARPLGEKLGASKSVIGKIVRGKTYKNAEKNLAEKKDS